MARKSNQQKKRSYRRSMKMMGGDGAATHAINVYGGMDSQHAVSGGDNTIAMNGGVQPVAVIKGGSALSPAPITGGTIELTPAPITGGTVALAPAPVTGGTLGLASAPIRGGAKGGSGIITDLAVPAVLIYANKALRGRHTSNKSYKKRRNSRRRSYRRR